MFNNHEDASDHEEEACVEVEEEEMVWNLIRWSNVVKIKHFLVESLITSLNKLNTSNRLYFRVNLIIQS